LERGGSSVATNVISGVMSLTRFSSSRGRVQQHKVTDSSTGFSVSRFVSSTVTAVNEYRLPGSTCVHNGSLVGLGFQLLRRFLSRRAMCASWVQRQRPPSRASTHGNIFAGGASPRCARPFWRSLGSIRTIHPAKCKVPWSVSLRISRSSVSVSTTRA
jgi:hypothetical protein